jgi:hypothetical protein
MKVWCITDRETPQLRLSGLRGVSVKIGGTTLKPGDSMDVPSHLIAEIQSALRNGLLSTIKPAVVESTSPTVPAPPVISSPVPVISTPVAEATESPETPEPDNTEHRRRRR